MIWGEGIMSYNILFDCRLSPVVKIRRWKEAQIEILVNGLGDPLITLKQISVQDGRQQKSEIW